MRKKLINIKLVLCISAIILIILGITVINNINKKEDGITAKIIIETIEKTLFTICIIDTERFKGFFKKYIAT